MKTKSLFVAVAIMVMFSFSASVSIAGGGKKIVVKEVIQGIFYPFDVSCDNDIEAVCDVDDVDECQYFMKVADVDQNDPPLADYWLTLPDGTSKRVGGDLMIKDGFLLLHCGSSDNGVFRFREGEYLIRLYK